MNANVKIHWIPQDQYGSVRSAYRRADGKLVFPRLIGAVWADMSDAMKRNSPQHAATFDAERVATVYRVAGILMVSESINSRAFKPLREWLNANASRRPFFVPGCARRECLGVRADIVNFEAKALGLL